MFLATTALSQFWDKTQEIFFLGSWCLGYDQRDEWKDLRYEVMPSVWDDREYFYQSEQDLDDIYERLLQTLAEHLNSIHQVSFSLRYWRILIGPWLMHYLQVFYDRYAHLSAALQKYENLNTYTLSPKCFSVPTDFGTLSGLIGNDRYNLQIFSQILSLMGHQFEERELPIDVPASMSGGLKELPQRSVSSMGKAVIKKLVRSSLDSLLSKSKVAMCDMYMSKQDMLRVMCKSRFQFVPLYMQSSDFPGSSAPVFDHHRGGFANLKSTDSFEEMVLKSLYYNFPTLYLEGYSIARHRILEKYPHIPQIVMTANGWLHNEPFKFFAAHAAERGSKLIAIQHGGVYGIAKCIPLESHESKVSDRFYVWGWATENNDQKLKNLPVTRSSDKLISGYKVEDSENNKDILLVTTNQPRYLYRFQSFPMGTQFEEYLQWQLEFIGFLPDEIRQSLSVRLHWVDHNRGVRPRFQQKYPGLNFDGNQSIFKSFTDSRIAVIDHCGTAFLEVLRYNIPTIFFWDFERCEIRPEVTAYFEKLCDIGVLFDSPHGAAEKVAEVYDNVKDWWMEQEIQAVRKDFVDRFMLKDENWLDIWVRELRSCCE